MTRRAGRAAASPARGVWGAWRPGKAFAATLAPGTVLRPFVPRRAWRVVVWDDEVAAGGGAMGIRDDLLAVNAALAEAAAFHAMPPDAFRDAYGHRDAREVVRQIDAGFDALRRLERDVPALAAALEEATDLRAAFDRLPADAWHEWGIFPSSDASPQGEGDRRGEGDRPCCAG